jgi:hypothetical protein
MDAGVEATQERLPEPGKRRGGWPLFPSGILPASLFALLLQRSGDFLLAVQEKATRAPKAHESLCFKVALKWAGWLSRSGCFRQTLKGCVADGVVVCHA